ncbi:MAG: thioredoxin family protein [Sulfolobales archaeon]|nr:thioredoxin family protein [Sulfolobales archaeon]MCX8208469.1 thioredoxin family protein [Sulfolobales archaeon]MDW8010223.1 thioredoxin family protein [Sulfolobales archaeon]
MVVLPAVVSSSGIYLYLYGATWCPACRTLDRFLSQSYAGIYYFCKIDVLDVCRTNFDSIRTLLVGKGILREHLASIPQTYVVRDGKYLLAIVVGAVTDSQFWKNLTSRTPRESVLLVIPPNTYEVPMSFSEQYELLSRYLLTAPRDTAAPVDAFSPQVVVPAVLVAAGAAVVVYAFVVRRR